MYKLEQIVKEHMQDCQNGMHEYNVNFTLEFYKDSDGDGRFNNNGKIITDTDKQEENIRHG
jgi:hypothetical protein